MQQLVWLVNLSIWHYAPQRVPLRSTYFLTAPKLFLNYFAAFIFPFFSRFTFFCNWWLFGQVVEKSWRLPRDATSLDENRTSRSTSRKGWNLSPLLQCPPLLVRCSVLGANFPTVESRHVLNSLLSIGRSFRKVQADKWHSEWIRATHIDSMWIEEWFQIELSAQYFFRCNRCGQLPGGPQLFLTT